MDTTGRHDEPAAGLAVLALAFGVGALVTSPLLIGVPLGVVGLVLAVIHLRGTSGRRALAIWGATLSIAAMIAGVSAALVYHHLLSGAIRDHRAASASRGSRSTGEWAEWRGTAAPAVTLTTVKGETIDLAGLQGKHVVVDFWATWCGPCVKTIPHLEALSKQDGVVVIGITDEDPERVRAFMATRSMTYHVVANVDDESLPAPFARVSALPTMFSIGRDGVIRSVLVGYHSFDALDARQWVTWAAEHWARGEQGPALECAAQALERELDASVDAELRAIFGSDAGYERRHARVESLVEGLLDHYERKHGGDFGRNRASLVWVIWSLGAERKDAEAVPLLVRVLEESALEEARWRAADALWVIRDRRAVPALLAALDDRSLKVAGFAASALGDLGDTSAAEALLALFLKLPDNRDEAKARAAEALGKLGDARAAGPLRESLAAIRDPEYVRWAEPALQRLEPNARGTR
jgi:cytochrome c biogenesis protein CcmG, thiol:disulfide interchange protein DsbE